MEDLNGIHYGHRERIRTRIAAGGLDRLQPHEVLEFLLYFVLPRQDVNQLSHNLIDHFGSLEDVLGGEIPELMKVDGVGRKTAMWIALVGECIYESNRARANESILLDNFMRVFIYACKKYREVLPPCTMQICLDAASRISYQRMICDSRAWGEPDILREAMADVISAQAKNVIILQFIGNMHADPDDYDKEHAREYSYALSCAGCNLLDVVLVGDGGVASMRQMDLIPQHLGNRLNHIICESYIENMPAANTLTVHMMEDENDELFDV